MSADEATPSVTIKYGKEFDKTWAVFRGAPSAIRSQIEAYFGFTLGEGTTLHDVVVYATDVAQGKRQVPVSGTWSQQGSSAGPPSMEQAVDNVQQSLGGTVVSDSDEKPSVWEQAKQPVEAPAPENPHASLIAQLEAAPSVDRLKELYAKNRTAFEAEDVKAAYKARGKALSA